MDNWQLVFTKQAEKDARKIASSGFGKQVNKKDEGYIKLRELYLRIIFRVKSSISNNIRIKLITLHIIHTF